MAHAGDDPAVDPAISAYVGAAADVLGLPIRPEYRPAVEQHFARLATLARLVEEHALQRSDEPAAAWHLDPPP